MLDSVVHQASPAFTMPFAGSAWPFAGSAWPFAGSAWPFAGSTCDAERPELALLARQTYALEFIASKLGALTGHTLELPPELQPDFEIARRRLLEEAV